MTASENRASRPAPALFIRHVTARLVRPTLLAVLTGALLVSIFTMVIVRFRATLREEVRRTIIERDAAVLWPVALWQLDQGRRNSERPGDLFSAVIESVQQKGMLAVAVFDERGNVVRFAPSTLLFAELPLPDQLQLLKGRPISRYDPEFPLARYFSEADDTPTPVLEVLLPLLSGGEQKLVGFAQYYIDARPLATELALVDRRIARLTAATLAIGGALLAGVVAAAYFGLRRAHRLVADRNARLVRANFELSLAAKTSALGQITSHLIHGLQGPVAGLRGVVAAREAGQKTAEDWAAAGHYAERMQAMIQEAVALLGDSASHATFELNGHELAGIIRQRSAAAAKEKGVAFEVTGGFDRGIDGHRGGLLCLIASNLVQNALEATEAGRAVRVTMALRDSDEPAVVTVADEGRGIPDELRAHLFEPGRSGRAGGSGLGLAISQLLARQIDATLTLESTGPGGTTFRLTLPLAER